MHAHQAKEKKRKVGSSIKKIYILYSLKTIKKNFMLRKTAKLPSNPTKNNMVHPLASCFLLKMFCIETPPTPLPTPPVRFSNALHGGREYEYWSKMPHKCLSKTISHL